MTVFTVGTASLGAEMAAARLLAPWFGASTIVWANTIATVLVALSIGYAIGGRLADRRPTMAGLSFIVLVAGALLSLVPFVAGPFLRLSVKAFANLSAGVFVGSLVGVCFLIAVPVLLLGMVSPYAVKLQVDDLADTGSTAGRLYAVGTVGSLAGTFLASLLLIPLVGTRRTFLIFALALVLVSMLGLRKTKVVALVVAVGIIAAMFLPVGITKPEAGSGKVVWEKETEYQYARVMETSSGKRTLELNEGQAVHSIYSPGDYLVGGYWDEMLALTLAGKDKPKRVAILGSAAGTTARAIAHYSPNTVIDAVEIDPDVTKVGKSLFDLRGAKINTYAADARPWLQAATKKYDAILVDAYRQPYIPFYLTTEEFFTLVRSRLQPDGVVTVNVGHPASSNALEKALTATMDKSLGKNATWRDPIEPTSTVLWASKSGTDPRTGLRELSGPDELKEVANSTAGLIEPGLRGGPVWTDDRAPVEWLIDSSLADVAEERP